MAALLVALAVMAVMMSVALPVWRHDAQREKEDELIFRGTQYVRAIRLYQRKTAALPVSVDALMQGHYLRKKYKDPITNDDFDLVSAANPNPGGATTGSTLPGGRGTQQTIGGPPASTGQLGPNSGGGTFGGTVAGGMLGVRSKSKDESIRLYQNRSHYNEWAFVFVGAQPGGINGGPRGGPPGRGGGPGGGGPGGGGPGGGGPGGGGPGGGFPGGGGRGPGGAGPGRGPGGPPVTFPGRGRE